MTTTPATQALLPGALELLPCPFCGGAAKVDDEESEDVGGYFASCTKCPVSAWGDARSEATTAWNTRQSHSLPGDVGIRVALATKAAAAWRIPSTRDPHFSSVEMVRPKGDCVWGYEQGYLAALAALTPSALSGDAGEVERLRAALGDIAYCHETAGAMRQKARAALATEAE